MRFGNGSTWGQMMTDKEIKRLQELADYRLKLLTKMPGEWVGLTDIEINNCMALELTTTARNIEAKLKAKNHVS